MKFVSLFLVLLDILLFLLNGSFEYAAKAGVQSFYIGCLTDILKKTNCKSRKNCNIYFENTKRRKEKTHTEKKNRKLYNSSDLFNILTNLNDEEIKKYEEVKRKRKEERSSSATTHINTTIPKKKILLRKWKYDLFEKIKNKIKEEEELKKKTTVCKYKYKLPIDFFKLGDTVKGKIISVENHLIKVDINFINFAHLYIKKYFPDKSKVKEKYQVGKFIDVVICYIHKRNKIIQVTDNEQEIQLLKENLRKLQTNNMNQIYSKNKASDNQSYIQVNKKQNAIDYFQGTENEKEVVTREKDEDEDKETNGIRESYEDESNEMCETDERNEPYEDDESVDETEKTSIHQPEDNCDVEFLTNDGEDGDLMYVKEKRRNKIKEITDYKIEDSVNGTVKFINEEGAYIDIGCNTLAFLNLGHYNKNADNFFKPVKKKKIQINDFLRNLKIRKIDILNNRIEVSFYSLEEEACLRILNQQETIDEQNKYMPCSAFINYNYHMINYLKKYNQLKKEQKMEKKGKNIVNLFEKEKLLDTLKETKHLKKNEFTPFIIKYNELSSPNSNYKMMLEQNKDNSEFLKEINSNVSSEESSYNDNNNAYEKDGEIKLDQLRKKNEMLKLEINRYKRKKEQEKEAETETETETKNVYQIELMNETDKSYHDPLKKNVDESQYGNLSDKENHMEQFSNKFYEYLSKERKTEIETEDDDDNDYDDVEKDDIFKRMAKELEKRENAEQIKEKIKEKKEEESKVANLKKDLEKMKKEFTKMNIEKKTKDGELESNAEKKEEKEEKKEEIEAEDVLDESLMPKKNKQTHDNKTNDNKPFYDIKEELSYIMKQNLNFDLNFTDDEKKYIEEASKLFGEDINTWNEKMCYYFGNKDQLTLEDAQIFNEEEFRTHLAQKKINTFDEYNKMLKEEPDISYDEKKNVDTEDFLAATFEETVEKKETETETEKEKEKEKEMRKNRQHEEDGENEENGENEEGEENEENEESNINKEFCSATFPYKKTEETQEETIENYLSTFLDKDENLAHEEKRREKGKWIGNVAEKKNEQKNQAENETKQEVPFPYNKKDNSILKITKVLRNIKEDMKYSHVKDDKFQKEEKNIAPVSDIININEIINKALNIGKQMQKKKLQSLLKHKEERDNYLAEKENKKTSKLKTNDTFLKVGKVAMKVEKNEEIATEMENEHMKKQEGEEANELKRHHLKNNRKRNEYDELKAYKYASYEVQGYYKRKRKGQLKTVDELNEINMENEDDENENVILTDEDITRKRIHNNTSETSTSINPSNNVNKDNPCFHNLENIKDILLLYGEKDYMTENNFLEQLLEKEKNANKKESDKIDKLIKSFRYANLNSEEWVNRYFRNKLTVVENKEILNTQNEKQENEKQENEKQENKHLQMFDFIGNRNFNYNFKSEHHSSFPIEPTFTQVESLQLKDIALQMGLIKNESVQLNDKELVDIFLKNRKFKRALKAYKINHKNVSISTIYKITKMLYFERPFPRKEKKRFLRLN